MMNALDGGLFSEAFAAWPKRPRFTSTSPVSARRPPSRPPDADHGRIESRLHWVMDVVFHDELMRLRTGNGPRNMSTIKHMAMNLIRNAGG